jgi:uncharacterized delta-60 repeat protein
LNPQNGALDPSFGNGGIATVDFNLPGSESDDRFRAMTLDAEGRIVLAGMASDSSSSTNFAVARLNPQDGSPDTSFGIGGKFVEDENVNVAGVAMQGAESRGGHRRVRPCRDPRDGEWPTRQQFWQQRQAHRLFPRSRQDNTVRLVVQPWTTRSFWRATRGGEAAMISSRPPQSQRRP